MIDLVTPQNALVANQAVTNATTNIIGATLPNPANFLKVGQVWLLAAPVAFLHTAAVSPTVIFELVYGATVIAAVPTITPVGTAGTFSGIVEGTFTVRTLGATGTVMGYAEARVFGLQTANTWGGGALCQTTATTVDTTATNAIVLRARMGSAVASNTLTFSQGWVQRLAG